jgi:hypothetical protein
MTPEGFDSALNLDALRKRLEALPVEPGVRVSPERI